jgi:EmrB/QacA subfamily drug resistance transporter
MPEPVIGPVRPSQQSRADAKQDAATKRSALLIAVLASFLTPFMVSSVNIALPIMGRELGMDAILLSWVPTSYLLSAAMFLVPFGRIADIHGRKRIFTAGIIVYTVASGLIAFSWSVAALLSLRVMQGFGSAMIFGTGIAIVTSVFPPSERGRVLGINVSAVYVGLALGPFLGGFLTQQFGWRSIFLANVPAGLAALYFIVRHLPGEWAEAKGERFDLGGAVLYAISLVMVMYGLTLVPTRAGFLLVLFGLFWVVAFILWELRAASPLLDMRLFTTNLTFSMSNIAALINYSATFAVTFLLSLYLQYLKGFTPREAGVVLIAQPVIMAAFSPLAGRLSDRVEPRIVASIGMGITALGLALFTVLQAATSIWYIVTVLMVIGLGFALFSSPNTNAVMSSIDRRSYGVGSAMLGTMRLTGQMLSMGLVMVVFSIVIGRVQITPAQYPLFLTSVRTLFSLCAVLCGAGIFASLARGTVHDGPDRS